MISDGKLSLVTVVVLIVVVSVIGGVLALENKAITEITGGRAHVQTSTR